jgi:ectoine hydroxylase
MQVRQDPVVYPGDFKSPLDRTQIASYIQNGFLFIESLFSEEEALLFRNELEKLKRAKTLKSREEAITERNSGELRSLFRIHKLHPLFEKLASDERIVKIAEFILGSKVYIHQSRLNFKPGFSGKEFYWHSDFETWHVEDGMPRMRALSVSISLMENNEFNGPLMLIPSSHHAYVACVGDTPDDHYKQSLKQQDYGVPDEASLRFLENKGGIAAPKGPAGSVTFFDCNVMHGSNSNISPYPRCNIFLVYNSVENRPVTPFCGKRPRPEFIAARANPESIEAKKNHYAGFMDKQRERKYAEN